MGYQGGNRLVILEPHNRVIKKGFPMDAFHLQMLGHRHAKPTRVGVPTLLERRA